MKLNKKILIPIAVLFVIVIILLLFSILYGNSYTVKTGKNVSFKVTLKPNKESKLKIDVNDSNNLVINEVNNTNDNGDFLYVLKDSTDKIVRKGLIHSDGDTSIQKLEKGSYHLYITYKGKKVFKLKGKMKLEEPKKGKYATLMRGRQINKKIQNFLGESFSYFSHRGNETVTDIKLADKMDPKYETEEYLVSSEDSLKPIYMWIEDKKVLYFYSTLPIEFGESAESTFTGLMALNNIKDLKYFSVDDTVKFTDMFRDCFSLTDIHALSYWNTDKADDMASMFSDCRSLININPLIAFNTSNVKGLGMFLSTTSVIDISVLQYFDTSNVTEMIGTFTKTNIQDFTPIANWNTENVKKMSYTFSETKIKSIDEIKNWDVSKVEDMDYIFGYCDNLEDISGLSEWEPIKLSSLEGSFSYTNIKNVDGLKNWDVSNLESLREAFYDCRNLKNIDGLSKWNTPKLTNLKGTFAFTGFPSTIPLANWNVSKVETMEETFGHSKIADTDGFEKWDTSSVKNFDFTFVYSKIKDLTGLKNWNVASGKNFDSIFEGCSELKNTNGVANWKVSNSASKSNAFYKVEKEVPAWAK